MPLPLFFRSVAGQGGATGVLSPPRHREIPGRPRRTGPPVPPRDRDGSDDDGGRGGGGDDRRPDWGDDGLGRLALGLGLVGITTLFSVLIAVWLLLLRPLQDWSAPLPALDALWVSTAFLAASSAAIEIAARRRARRERRAALRWLTASFALGAAFLAAQIGLWVALWHSGTLPSSGNFAATFFCLTGLHALHVLGGLGFFAVLGVQLALPAPDRRPPGLRLGAVYWHFMGGVWLVLFTLLVFVR